jgi:hypothetical protein
MNQPKIKLVFPIFLLLVLVWGNYALFHFSHYHVDASGQIVLHAHPFHQENPQNQTQHTHTKNEFSILSFIFEVLSVFVIGFALVLIALKLNRGFQPVFQTQCNPLNLIFPNISRRGPPFVFHVI